MASEETGNRMWGLKELPLPDPVAWTPETYGWLVLGVLVMTLAVWLARARYRVWQGQAYRRAALSHLAKMQTRRQEIEALPLLLRSTALKAYPREEVAGLRGSEWITWLNGAGAEFAPEDGAWIDELTYRPGLASELPEATAEHLIAASRAFVRSHHARV